MDIPHGERTHDALIKAHEDEAESRKPSENARHSKIHVKFEHLPDTDARALGKFDSSKLRDPVAAAPYRRLVGPYSTRDQCPKGNRGAVLQLHLTGPMPHNPNANKVILVESQVERVEMLLIGQVQDFKIGNQPGDLIQSLH